MDRFDAALVKRKAAAPTRKGANRREWHVVELKQARKQVQEHKAAYVKVLALLEASREVLRNKERALTRLLAADGAAATPDAFAICQALTSVQVAVHAEVYAVSLLQQTGEEVITAEKHELVVAQCYEQRSSEPRCEGSGVCGSGANVPRSLGPQQRLPNDAVLSTPQSSPPTDSQLPPQRPPLDAAASCTRGGLAADGGFFAPGNGTPVREPPGDAAEYTASRRSARQIVISDASLGGSAQGPSSGQSLASGPVPQGPSSLSKSLVALAASLGSVDATFANAASPAYLAHALRPENPASAAVPNSTRNCWLHEPRSDDEDDDEGEELLGGAGPGQAASVLHVWARQMHMRAALDDAGTRSSCSGTSGRRTSSLSSSSVWAPTAAEQQQFISTAASRRKPRKHSASAAARSRTTMTPPAINATPAALVWSASTAGHSETGTARSDAASMPFKSSTHNYNNNAWLHADLDSDSDSLSESCAESARGVSHGANLLGQGLMQAMLDPRVPLSTSILIGKHTVSDLQRGAGSAALDTLDASHQGSVVGNKSWPAAAPRLQQEDAEETQGLYSGGHSRVVNTTSQVPTVAAAAFRALYVASNKPDVGEAKLDVESRNTERNLQRAEVAAPSMSLIAEITTTLEQSSTVTSTAQVALQRALRLIEELPRHTRTASRHIRPAVASPAHITHHAPPSRPVPQRMPSAFPHPVIAPPLQHVLSYAAPAPMLQHGARFAPVPAHAHALLPGQVGYRHLPLTSVMPMHAGLPLGSGALPVTTGGVPMSVIATPPPPPPPPPPPVPIRGATPVQQHPGPTTNGRSASPTLPPAENEIPKCEHCATSSNSHSALVAHLRGKWHSSRIKAEGRSVCAAVLSRAAPVEDVTSSGRAASPETTPSLPAATAASQTPKRGLDALGGDDDDLREESGDVTMLHQYGHCLTGVLIADEEVIESSLALLRQLYVWQMRKAKKSPEGLARAHKRCLAGLKEGTWAVKKPGRTKLVVLARNVQVPGADSTIMTQVRELLKLCEAASVPVVMGPSRKQLGLALSESHHPNRFKRMSAVAILDVSGADNQWLSIRESLSRLPLATDCQGSPGNGGDRSPALQHCGDAEAPACASHAAPPAPGSGPSPGALGSSLGNYNRSSAHSASPWTLPAVQSSEVRTESGLELLQCLERAFCAKHESLARVPWLSLSSCVPLA